MALKYAYIHPLTREYLYTDTPETLVSELAKFAAQVYVEHYCNGQPYTIVETQEDGSEKWYAPTGEPILSPADIEALVVQQQGFPVAGKIAVTELGGSV